MTRKLCHARIDTHRTLDCDLHFCWSCKKCMFECPLQCRLRASSEIEIVSLRFYRRLQLPAAGQRQDSEQVRDAFSLPTELAFGIQKLMRDERQQGLTSKYRVSLAMIVGLLSRISRSSHHCFPSSYKAQRERPYRGVAFKSGMSCSTSLAHDKLF